MKILTVILREMSDDFFEQWLNSLQQHGIPLADEFGDIGIQIFSDDYGYTKSETTYKIINDKEEANAREFVRKLRKGNLRDRSVEPTEDGNADEIRSGEASERGTGSRNASSGEESSGPSTRS